MVAERQQAVTARQNPVRVLLVEDYAPDEHLLRELLHEAAPEFALHGATSMAEAEERLRGGDFDLVMLDLGLPDGSGVDNVRRLRRIAPGVAIVVLTGLDDDRTALEALHAGAQEYVIKGSLDGAPLVRTLRHALERNRLVLELERRQRADYYRATHDQLTGLPNRLLLGDRFRQVLSQAERKGEPFAYCYLDLDGFKEVNDRHGHAVGDALLQQVARILRDGVRDSDTAARVGGDEFVLLLHPLHDGAQARAIVERIVSRIDAIDCVDGHPVQIGASAGIAVYPADGTEADALERAADLAMYRDKRTRRARRIPQLDGGSLGHLNCLHAWLRLSDRRPAALSIRMPTTAVALDVLDAVVAATAPQSGLEWVGRVGIELSADSLTDQRTAARLAAAADRLAGQARLQVELPVGEIGRDPELLAALAVLRSRGVGLAVTRFAQYPASVARVSRLPLDGLQLDPAVLAGLRQGQADVRSRFASVRRLVQALEITLDASGVAEPGDLALLAELDCVHVEGPLLGGACSLQQLRDSGPPRLPEEVPDG